MSIDALEALSNSAMTKASDHTINIMEEHNNKNEERLVGLYHGSESMYSHVLHYGDCRMSSSYGTSEEQQNASMLHPRKLGMVTEMEDMAVNGFNISTGSTHVKVNVIYFLSFDMPGMIKWLKLNSQTSRDGCPFCEKRHNELYTDPEHLAPLYKMEDLVQKGHAYEKEKARLLLMKENGIKEFGKIPNRRTVTVTNAMIDALKWKYGCTGIPMLPNMSKWQICPDSLHCILNIHVLLWELVSSYVFTYNRTERLIHALRSIGLHATVASVRALIRSKDLNKKKLMGLKLKGPVCMSMELFILRFFYELTGGTVENEEETTEMIGIIIAYMKFNALARILRSTNPTADEVGTFAANALDFSKHIQHLMGASSIESKSYLHVLVECLPRFITFWYTHLGIGPAVWSTSCGESKNVHCSQGEHHHSNGSSDSMIQVMSYDMRSCCYCPSTVTKRQQTCSKCSEMGHNKKNMSCPEHEDSRTHCTFSSLEERMSVDEKMMLEAHKQAFKEYFLSRKKEPIKHMTETYVSFE